MRIAPPRARPEDWEHPFVGHVVYQGLDIDLETARGAVRSGVDPDGVAWSVRMPWPYGEIRGTMGADGDPVDAFVGPLPHAPYAYVIQAKLPGSQSFDETKVMLGFNSRMDALKAFRSAYTAPGFLLGVTRWPMSALLEALRRPIQSGPLDARALRGILQSSGA